MDHRFTVDCCCGQVSRQAIQAGQGPLRGSHGGGGYLPNNARGSGIQHRWVLWVVIRHTTDRSTTTLIHFIHTHPLAGFKASHKLSSFSSVITITMFALSLVIYIYLPPRLPQLITGSPSFTVIIVRRQLSDARDISTGGGCHTWQKNTQITCRLRQVSHACVELHRTVYSIYFYSAR